MSKNTIISTVANITTNYIPKANGTSITNSSIQENGSLITIASGITGFRFNDSIANIQYNGSLTIGVPAMFDVIKFYSNRSTELFGTLTGTSAKFSGNMVLGTTALSGGGAAQWLTANGTAYGGGFISSVNNVAKAYYYYDNTANAAVVEGVAGVGVTLLANNVPALTIAYTGAATFSSSAASNIIFNSTNANGGYLSFQNSGTASGYIGSAYHLSIGGSNADLAMANDLGNLTFVTGGLFIERMRITSGGNVLVNNSTDYGHKFQVNGAIVSINNTIGSYSTTSGATYGWFNSGAGTLLLTNSGVANVGSFNMSTGVYTATSDINKKKDFELSTIGLKEILQLKPTLYRMKSDNTESKKELGFIAQEVKEFIPQAFVNDADFIGLNDMPIIAALVKAVQEQQAQIEELNAKIEELRKV